MIMSKNLGVKPYLFPMPTYMIGIYNENNTVDVMMMGWGKFAPKIWLRGIWRPNTKQYPIFKPEKRLPWLFPELIR